MAATVRYVASRVPSGHPNRLSAGMPRSPIGPRVNPSQFRMVMLMISPTLSVATVKKMRTSRIAGIATRNATPPAHSTLAGSVASSPHPVRAATIAAVYAPTA